MSFGRRAKALKHDARFIGVRWGKKCDIGWGKQSPIEIRGEYIYVVFIPFPPCKNTYLHTR